MSVYPDEPGTWTNVDRCPNHEAKNTVYSIIQKLADMAEIGEPVILQFTPEAQAAFNDWRNDLENNKLLNTDDHPALIAHLAKYRSLLPSLALIIHLVDTCDAEVTPVSDMAIIKACGWCDYLESHARRIYGDATNNPIKAAKLILSKIKSGKLSNGFNPREINRKGWSGLTDTAEIKEGIEALIDYGYLLECVIETSGRPAVTYRVHPKIMEDIHNG
jgi:putative DNA primase/helicase